MRIGLLVLSIGDFGNKSYYNLQEVGLGRELDALFEEVLIYRLVDSGTPQTTEAVEGCRNTSMTLLPAGRLGSNGIPPLDKLDASVDMLICFSDTQLFFSSVYKWSKKNGIKLIPYIGVCGSHSDNPVRRRLMNLLFYRNIRLYRKLPCLAKTPDVRDELLGAGVSDVTVAPVGLDISRLKPDYAGASAAELKTGYGFAPDDRIILFIGRMTAEKQPCRMIEIFAKALRQDPSCRLLMVGNGELSGEVSRLIYEYRLNEKTTRLERVPNTDIWELYRIADCLVNLNQHEIYGMVLLEAMYYGCRVIAWHAPGPDFIIQDGVTGYLVGSDEEACDRILNGKPLSEQSAASVTTDFSWKKAAGIIRALA